MPRATSPRPSRSTSWGARGRARGRRGRPGSVRRARAFGRRRGIEKMDFAARALNPPLSSLPTIASRMSVARSPRVLVVEDDVEISQVLKRSLRLEGYEVREAGDGEAALTTAREFLPDLVILDLGLPKLDGVDVARTLRKDGDVPILVLTARDALEAKVVGLDAGADDYLVKPFEREELLARLRALLRRQAPPATSESTRLTFADVVLDTLTREVTVGGQQLSMTRLEFSLLELFLRHPRQVLTREVIFDRVWGYDFGANSNSLEVYVGYLRRKTEAGDRPRLIHTVRGVGYVLRDTAP